MRRIWLGLLILPAVAAAPLHAQDHPDAPPSRSRRMLIERQFADRVGETLQLTDDQKKRLATVTEQFAEKRKALRMREKALRRALADQLQPGVAAKDDSVSRLTTELVDLRLRFAENARDELKEVSKFLSPVQRARLFTMRERLFHAVDERLTARSRWDQSGQWDRGGMIDRSAEMRRLAMRLRDDSDWQQLRQMFRSTDSAERHRRISEFLQMMDSTQRVPGLRKGPPPKPAD